jgi:hypothetical protein
MPLADPAAAQSTKIHALADAFVNPYAFMLTTGQDHDLACAEPLFGNANPGKPVNADFAPHRIL